MSNVNDQVLHSVGWTRMLSSTMSKMVKIIKYEGRMGDIDSKRRNKEIKITKSYRV